MASRKHNEIHLAIAGQYIRLIPNRPNGLPEFMRDYVYKEISPSTLLQMVSSYKTDNFPMPQAMENEEVLTATSKILSLMEASNTWEEFQKLNERRKLNAIETGKDGDSKNEPTDFDKLLKAFLAVAKPQNQASE